MVKITNEELKNDTIALHIEKRNATKMERLIEKEITRFLTETGKD